MKAEPLRTTGKRRIEMTTAEWVSRLVTEIPFRLKKGCGPILKLREEKEIKSAVEWLKERIEKAKWDDPVSELAKTHNEAMDYCIEFVNKALEDVIK